MIKYKPVYFKDILYSKYAQLRKKVPLLCLYENGDQTYTIPISKDIIEEGWCYHNDNGPAELFWDADQQNYEEEWWYYDKDTTDKEEYLDPNWRKRIEIGLFL